MPFTLRFMLVICFHTNITTVVTTTIRTAVRKLRVPFVLADLTFVLEFLQYAYILDASPIVTTGTVDTPIAIPVTTIVTTGASRACPVLPREHETRNANGFFLHAITAFRFVFQIDGKLTNVVATWALRLATTGVIASMLPCPNGRHKTEHKDHRDRARNIFHR